MTRDLSEMKEKISRYFSAPAASFKPMRWGSDNVHFRTVVLIRDLHSEHIYRIFILSAVPSKARAEQTN